MATAKDRELIPVSSQAHEHLRNVVQAYKSTGLPTNGTLLASQAILSIPLPTPQPEIRKKPIKKTVEKKRQRKAAVSMTPVPAAL